MKVTTDACLFGAWCAEDLSNKNSSFGLDIGAGTGLLSLQVAQKNKLQIHAIEIDEDAARQAEENIIASAFSSQIKVLNTDAAHLNYARQYDVIISNPPFYENELQSALPKRNLAHHNGLPLKALFDIVKRNLSDAGQFYLLLPYKRLKEAESLLLNNNLMLHEKCVVYPSLLHLPQRVMLNGSHHHHGRLRQSSIAIKNECNTYTSEFVLLLKDYYLHL